MTTRSRPLSLATALLVVVVLSFGSLAAMPADAAARNPRTASSAVAATDGPGELRLHGDTYQSAAARRRPSYAWSGKRIRYYESIPAKWDWSLSTAIAKWNGTGGGIRFVRTTNRKKARLVISYGSIGTAAGMATLGRSRHAWVRLSSRYTSADSLDAYNRIEVMGIFSHELGHVLGFAHTSTRCSLMSPVLDVRGCNTVPTTPRGYYACRTIDRPLLARFLRIYGGRAKSSGTWCPIDSLPPVLSNATFSGGNTAGSPVAVRWTLPRSVPSGSHVVIRKWSTSKCGAPPIWAETFELPVAARAWQDSWAESASDACFNVQLVNRYGAGRSAVARVLTRWMPPPEVEEVPE